MSSPCVSAPASGVTGAGDGCKPCLVADCGVYGLPISTSRQPAHSCAWPPCHRAFPMHPPKQPRHQTFRTRGGEAWHPHHGEEAPLPQAAAPPIKWSKTRTPPRHGDRRSSPSSFPNPRRIRPPNDGFSRDAPGAALAFSRRLFYPFRTASDVSGAKSAASNVIL